MKAVGGNGRGDNLSAMKVIKHATDPKRFVATAASLVTPGGLLLVSTLDRTLRSFALAIVGAEYVLRWLEPGRRRWEQFVTPLELTGFARAAGLKALRGMVYDPFRRDWRLSSDTGVNYLFAATNPAVSAGERCPAERLPLNCSRGTIHGPASNPGLFQRDQ
jgi:2-polyprenyl-6-hydroxyphenyl methylase / 3-demethylubiquinone-9 3-methyltransferase